MLELLAKFHLDLLIALGLPSVGAMVFVIRHFWMKSKCFAILQQRVEHQEKATIQGQKEHEKIFERLNAIDKNISALQAQNEIILKKIG